VNTKLGDVKITSTSQDMTAGGEAKPLTAQPENNTALLPHARNGGKGKGRVRKRRTPYTWTGRNPVSEIILAQIGRRDRNRGRVSEDLPIISCAGRRPVRLVGRSPQKSLSRWQQRHAQNLGEKAGVWGAIPARRQFSSRHQTKKRDPSKSTYKKG